MEDIPNVPILIRQVNHDLLAQCQGKYVVAEFLPFKDIDSMTVEAIPGYWLAESKTATVTPIVDTNGKIIKIIHSYMFAYIPLSSPYNIKKAKQNNVLPDMKTWLKWPVSCVLNKIFDDYQQARQEEIRAEAYPYSDLEGYVVEDLPQGRTKLIKKRWPGDTSSASSERDDSDVEEVSDIPSHPTKPLENDSSNHYEADCAVSKTQGATSRVPKKNQIVNKKASETLNVPSPPLYVAEILEEIDHTADSSMENRLLSLMPLETSNMPLTSTLSHKAFTVDSGTEKNNATLYQDTPVMLSGTPMGLEFEIELENMDLLGQLGEGKTNDDFYKACFLRILNQIVEQKRKLEKVEKMVENLILKSNSSYEGSDEHKRAMKNLIPLPVGTMEELQNLNKTLQENTNYYTYLRNFMTDCCPIPVLPNYDSKTIKQELHKVVGHIFHRIITNELALLLNMCGRNIKTNTPKKEGMRKFPEILTVTFDAIKPKAQLANLELNQSQSDSAVGEWLRLAKNRLQESKELKRQKMAERRALKNV